MTSFMNGPLQNALHELELYNKSDSLFIIKLEMSGHYKPANWLAIASSSESDER